MQPISTVVLIWWAAEALGESMALGTMLATGAQRRWPSLAWMLSLSMARHLTCLPCVLWWHSPAVYFWGYEITTTAIMAAQLWVMVQIAIGLFGTRPKVRWTITRAVPAFSASALACSILISFTDDRSASYVRLIFATDHLEYAVQLAWCVTFLAILLTGKLVAEFSHGARGICAGFALRVGLSQVASLLWIGPTINDRASILMSVSSLLGCAVWCMAFIRHIQTLPAAVVHHNHEVVGQC